MARSVLWRCPFFSELELIELHELSALRQRVFVVEQECVYLDADGLDPSCWHLLGWQDDRLAAYARILPRGLRYPEASIGRIVTAPEARGQGLGKELMHKTLVEMARLFGPCPVRISAQCYLERFYQEFGFVPQGEAYDEDGIPHIAMLRAADEEA